MSDTDITEAVADAMDAWQQLEDASDEIRDTIEAYEDLARFDAPLTPAEAAAQNHADHLAYVREELRKEAWRI